MSPGSPAERPRVSVQRCRTAAVPGTVCVFSSRLLGGRAPRGCARPALRTAGLGGRWHGGSRGGAPAFLAAAGSASAAFDTTGLF